MLRLSGEAGFGRDQASIIKAVENSSGDEGKETMREKG